MIEIAFAEDIAIAKRLACDIKERGGRAYYVGGFVRDHLLGIECKDIDIEVYGVTPNELRDVIARHGEVLEKGSSFGVLSIRHTNIDVSMPRKERLTGRKHVDFDVSVEPYMSTRDACSRRDFTFNAMLMDVLTGEIIDEWGGREDLNNSVLRHVNDATFIEDALRVFRAAQFAARFNCTITDQTQRLLSGMDVSELSRERVFDELNKALLKADKPSVFFRVLMSCDKLDDFMPEIKNLAGVEQSPRFHPEGDVFEHTMLVLDSAASLRDRAEQPLYFMLSALCHDLGKAVSTTIDENGKIHSYSHPQTGATLAVRFLKRLTDNAKLIEYVSNMVEMHMRPNVMAYSRSKKKKTRMMFDESVCPNDLILLSRADAMGKTDEPYDEALEAFLRERLDDYNEALTRPMVTGNDLISAGLEPNAEFSGLIKRARTLHFAGVEKERALKEILKFRKSTRG